jgi:hypothetical protein
MQSSFGVQSIPRRNCGRISKSKRRNRRFRKEYSTPFGKIVLHCDEVISDSTDESRIVPLPAPGENRIMEIGFDFIPRPWLTSKAYFASGSWGSLSNSGVLNFSLLFSPVVDKDSEIFTACRLGDIVTMRRLFDSKQASPYDVNQYGQNLLLVRALRAIFIYSTLISLLVGREGM